MSLAAGLPLLQATRARPTHRAGSHILRSSSITGTRIISPLTSPQAHHGRRSFHWPSAISAAIDGSQNLIINLHTITHLPWFLTIPLTALTVSAVFRLPFTIYTQRVLQRRTELVPLLQAWNARLQHEAHKKQKIAASQSLSEVKKLQDKVTKRIYSKLGLQEWRLYSVFLSFPFWLVAIDGIRRLCGGPRGIIGYLVTRAAGSVDGSEAATTTAGTATEPSLSPDVAATDFPSSPDFDPTVASSAVEETARTAIIDPSLTYEGCLWFTDLTTSDPYHILPLALSASLLLNLLPKTKEKFLDRVRVARGLPPKSAHAQTLAGDEKVGRGERIRANFYLSMIGLATLVGPLTMDLPAALHLYWLASSASNGLLTKGVRHFMPVEAKPRKRCAGLELPVIRPQRWQKS